MKKTLTALVLAAVAVARAGAGDESPGPEPAPVPTPRLPHRPPRPRSRSRSSLVWTSTASRCSTWATSRARTTRTGSTCCGRPSCPPFENEFGEDGHFFAGVRQSRLGVKGYHPDRRRRGQDDLRVRALRHRRRRRADDVPAAPRLRRARRSSAPARPGARSWTSTSSRTRSSTGDRTAWCSSATCRCAGCRCQAATRASRSRSSGRARPRDEGDYADRIELAERQGRFPLPDLSGAVPLGAATGATSRSPGIVRYMEWDDLNDDAVRPRAATPSGWGINLSSNLKVGEARDPRLPVVFGEGVQNYMNDAPVDVGHREQLRRIRGPPIEGEALPILGLVAFVDLNWSDEWTSTDRLLDARHRQQRRPGGRRLQEGPVRARQHPVSTRRRT